MRYLPLPGRILFALIFIVSSFGNFTSQNIALAAHHGVPAAHLLVPIAGVLSLVGGLLIAFGYQARLGAILLIVFLVPVTLMMHNFWAVHDPAARMMQQINFMKNVALLGAALMIVYFGAGPVSVDERLRARPRHRILLEPTAV